MSSQMKATLVRGVMFALGSLLSLVILSNYFPVHHVRASGSDTIIYTHIATTRNTNHDLTELDNAVTNNNPNAIVFVTQNWAPYSVYNNHPVGVRYQKGRWAIFNQDHAPIPNHTAFNVYAFFSSTAYSTLFTHIATTDNSNKNYTTLNTPSLNYNPDAILLVTPNYTPHSVYNPHPSGVWFNGTSWVIFNLDKAPIPNHAAFNVFILSSKASGTLVHIAEASNTSGNHTNMDSAPASINPKAIVFITPTLTSRNVYNNHNTAVWYHAGHWSIFNEDGAPILPGVAFNVNS